MTGKIDSRDVSFVLQGKNVKGQTSLCCQSIRKHFPGAEIIFSTYVGEDVADLDFDVLVESVDPGAPLLFGNRYNNINRILLTTKAGLEKASRPFCARMRSDLCFDNDKLLTLANCFEKRNPNLSVFKRRVVFYQLWSRKCEDLKNGFSILCPWHLSDWLQFGLTEDIKNYFNASSFISEPDFSNHFLNPANRLKGLWHPHVKWRFPPEQYFCTSFFRQFFKEADMMNLQDFSDEKMEKSREVLANNIIIGGYKETGCRLLKKGYRRVSKNCSALITPALLNNVFTYADFLADYKKYCDPDFSIPFKYRWKQDLRNQKYYKHYKKHFSRLTAPVKAFLRWLNDLLATPYYALRLLLNIFGGAFGTLFREIRRRLKK